jgi:hypothetical protein
LHGVLRIPFAWIADIFHKGISREVPSITIHASAEFSRLPWDTPPEESPISYFKTLPAGSSLISDLLNFTAGGTASRLRFTTHLA